MMIKLKNLNLKNKLLFKINIIIKIRIMIMLIK